MPANPVGESTPGMKLLINTREDSTLVVCAGRLTAEVAAMFKSEIKDLIPRANRLVLDLSNVSYMDSSGLGAVVGLYVSARAAHCKLELINLSRRVRELLGVTKLLSVFETCGEFPIRMP
jgi:anti-anti-sigma factor